MFDIFFNLLEVQVKLVSLMGMFYTYFFVPCPWRQDHYGQMLLIENAFKKIFFFTLGGMDRMLTCLGD